jgi:hypothetical protein
VLSRLFFLLFQLPLVCALPVLLSGFHQLLRQNQLSNPGLDERARWHPDYFSFWIRVPNL